MNFSELIPVAYENAKAKGFWDRKRPIAEFVGLIISELGEAFEEYRSGSREGFRSTGGKPVGLPSELADAVIFLADMCGGHGIKVRYRFKDEVSAPNLEEFPAIFCQAARTATEIFVGSNSNLSLRHEVVNLLDDIEILAEISGVDLSAAIEQKMAYNATRSKRHGGKRL